MGVRTVRQMENPLLSKLQILQDLKFLIDRHCNQRLSYKNYRIFEITVGAFSINLITEYQAYEESCTLDKMAEIIVAKYRL